MSRNPISLEVLETLDAIDRRGSFAKAAEELNKATSAISYSIQKLEEQLDVTIFQRQGRRSVLTPAGRLILLEGREILQTTSRLASKAKEVATGWETRINISIESMQPYPLIFQIIQQFLQDHSTIEIDINESVLNGSWEALELDEIDLAIGAPGPVPMQKGFGTISLAPSNLVAVISSKHQFASIAHDKAALALALPSIRKIISHDTSKTAVSRSEGLRSDGNICYVQTIEQKLEAILAGIGIGHLPAYRVQGLIDKNLLTPIAIENTYKFNDVMAWKISNKGKGLKVLIEQLAKALAKN